MPTNDLYLTLSVAIRSGQGKPDRENSVSIRVPAGGGAGLSIPDPKKLKIGMVIEQMGTLLDQEGADL